MSDRELELLRRRKLLELKKQLKEKPEREEARVVDSEKLLGQYFIGRAWEVLKAARLQYPEAAAQVERALVKLIMNGRIRGKITGEDLYGLFLRLGMKVHLQTHIRVLEHGKVKSLEEKIREETST